MIHPPAGPAMKSEVFKTVDGATLVGRLFHPGGAPRAVLILNGATAVAQDYYQHFAAYAAEKLGVVVFTFDYRDMGRSATEDIKRSRALMSDWGLADQRAARAKMRRLFPGLPLRVIGHSLGGMTMPLQDDTQDIEQMTCVASGNVHHSDHPWPYRLKAMMFWFGVVPTVVKCTGYMPGHRIGIGADLPGPAYWQWRQWCTSMRTFGGQEGNSLPAPDWRAADTRLRMIAFEDDVMIPPHSVARLAQDYGKPASVVEVISPAAAGLRAIGRLGVFARRSAAVWDKVLVG